MSINITLAGNSVHAKSPYHPDLPPRARNLGGRWNATSKLWQFDARDEQRVRELYQAIYGTDGNIETSDLVTLQVTVKPTASLCSDNQSALFVGGRAIGRAFDRDSGAKNGEGVVFLKGGLGSGGSRKNWDTRTTKGAIFEIRDLPRAAAEQVIAELPYEIETALIIDDSPAASREKLEAEKARLLARIEQINTLLAAA